MQVNTENSVITNPESCNKDTNNEVKYGTQCNFECNKGFIDTNEFKKSSRICKGSTLNYICNPSSPPSSPTPPEKMPTVMPAAPISPTAAPISPTAAPTPPTAAPTPPTAAPTVRADPPTAAPISHTAKCMTILNDKCSGAKRASKGNCFLCTKAERNKEDIDKFCNHPQVAPGTKDNYFNK